MARAEPFAAEANALLNLRDVSVTTVQACVLLGAVSIVEGEAGAETVFYAAACRIASFLDLPNLPTQDPLRREIHIRGKSTPAVREKSIHLAADVLSVLVSVYD